MKRAAALAAVTVAGGALALLVTHCTGESSSHPYSARQYVEGRDCVLNPVAIDVVTGPTPDDCTPVCLIGSNTLVDSGPGVYVGKMCPPLPPKFDSTAVKPVCEKALAAFERADYCTQDGGSTNPKLPDAGPDASDAARD